MKIVNQGIIPAALFLASLIPSFAVVDQKLEIQGTNLVLSWPSTGNEYYLVQHRTTLDPETPWTTLTNNYPANSTNRTTLVIPCCDLPPFSFPAAGGGTNSGGGEPPSPGSSMAMSQSSESESSPELWATQSSGTAVPLSLFPPGWDTSGMTIFEVEKSESQAQSFSGESLESFDGGSGEPMNLSSGGCDCPDMAFFRVFHIPNFPASITNFTFDGPIFIPVNFEDYRDRVDNIEVLLNGEVMEYAEFTSLFYNNQTNWGMGVYFDHVTNGIYQIELKSTLRLNDEIGDETVYVTLTNKMRSIVVSNEIMYPEWNDLIQGDTYTFKAQTANLDTDWSIDIFDASENYVNTGSGHTTNGQISWTWDLNDYLGNNRDTFDSDPYFFSQVTFNTAAGPQTTRATRPPVKGDPDRGEWIIAFQDRWYADAPGYPASLQTKYIESKNLIRGGPLLIDEPAQLFPLKFGTNVYTQAERDQSWDNFKPWLGDLYTRNLYYAGHGTRSTIGNDRHVIGTNGFITGGAGEPNSKAFLTSKDAKTAIGLNRFRFVFLHGCSTALGDWPHTFGIGRATNSIADYENDPRHRRPSVFVGWNQNVGGQGWGTADDELDFESFWMGNWVNDFPRPNIVDAIKTANTSAGWITPAKLDSALRVYGYREMKMRDYNRKGDWRWP